MTASEASAKPKRHRHEFGVNGRCRICNVSAEVVRQRAKDARQKAAIDNAKEREKISQMKLWPGLGPVAPKVSVPVENVCSECGTAIAPNVNKCLDCKPENQREFGF